MQPSVPLPMAVQVHTSAALDGETVAAVQQLATVARGVDGLDPLGEHTQLGLTPSSNTTRVHLVARTVEDNTLVGYAQLDPAELSAEAVVAPAYRSRGVGQALATTALAQYPQVRAWAHGTLPGARALADRMQAAASRQLFIMTLAMPEALPAYQLPAGFNLRAFRPGQDEAAWLEVNARAFTELPDQGGWGPADLAARLSQDWFDPEGFLIATSPSGEIAGFHWTKVHAGADKDDPGPIGEVYVVGVDPSYRGHGLGRALTLAGLDHLSRRGLDTVILYVDAANPAAVALYESLGFQLTRTDTEYRVRQ